MNKSDFPSLTGNKVEIQDTCPAVEGTHSPLLDINNKISEASPSTAENQRPGTLSTPTERPKS